MGQLSIYLAIFRFPSIVDSRVCPSRSFRPSRRQRRHWPKSPLRHVLGQLIFSRNHSATTPDWQCLYWPERVAQRERWHRSRQLVHNALTLPFDCFLIWLSSNLNRRRNRGLHSYLDQPWSNTKKRHFGISWTPATISKFTTAAHTSAETSVVHTKPPAKESSRNFGLNRGSVVHHHSPTNYPKFSLSLRTWNEKWWVWQGRPNLKI